MLFIDFLRDYDEFINGKILSLNLTDSKNFYLLAGEA